MPDDHSTTCVLGALIDAVVKINSEHISDRNWVSVAMESGPRWTGGSVPGPCVTKLPPGSVGKFVSFVQIWETSVLLTACIARGYKISANGLDARSFLSRRQIPTVLALPTAPSRVNTQVLASRANVARSDGFLFKIRFLTPPPHGPRASTMAF